MIEVSRPQMELLTRAAAGTYGGKIPTFGTNHRTIEILKDKGLIEQVFEKSDAEREELKTAADLLVAESEAIVKAGADWDWRKVLTKLRDAESGLDRRNRKCWKLTAGARKFLEAKGVEVFYDAEREVGR